MSFPMVLTVTIAVVVCGCCDDSLSGRTLLYIIRMCLQFDLILPRYKVLVVWEVEGLYLNVFVMFGIHVADSISSGLEPR